ncbi:sensor histidine kinase [Oxalobacteraceae bacterium A2-2]
MNAPASPFSPIMTAMTAYYSTRGWRQVTGAWLALALFDATQTVVSMRAMGMQHAWLTLFFVTMATWAVWALCTPAVLALLRRQPLPARSVRPWLAHGAAWLATGALWAAWGALLEHAANPYAYAHADPYGLLWRGKFLGNLVGGAILYGAIVVLSISLDTQERLQQEREAGARLAALLAQAQLAALRLQLEPHFIFNALNAVTGLIRARREAEAVAAIAALGDLLRRVTDRSELQFVPLQDEAGFVRQYLDIQQLRFAERLRCQIDIPEPLLAAQVPDFILQPLVENAIKHGIAKRARGGALRVMAERDGGLLTLSVYNEGPALSEPLADGVGLSNTRLRLAALYGEAATLVLRNQDGGVLASVALPWRRA